MAEKVIQTPITGLKKKKKKKKNVGICAKENSMTCLMRMRTVAGCDHCHNSQIY